MSEFIKKNFIVIVAFTLPVAFVVVLAIVLYLPGFFVSTDYNFVYATCSEGVSRYSYDCGAYLQDRYQVVDNKLISREVDVDKDSDQDGTPDIEENYEIRFFLHNTQTDESKEITLKKAQNMEFDKLVTSPDGVTLSEGYNRGGGFLFFNGSSSYDYYLRKGNKKSKLNLINNDDSYYHRNNFRFIGWVLSEQ